MRTQPLNSPRRVRRPPPGGFTLTELLVVVAILGLLMGTLLPSLVGVVTQTYRKAVCSNNERTIARACGQYALRDPRNRLPTVFTDKKNGTTTWGKMGDPLDGNPACLWLLITEKQCDRNAFLCPEAGSTRSWQVPLLDAVAFRWDSVREVSTLSYSFISMTRPPVVPVTYPEKLPDKMSLTMTPGTLVVLTDKNPRTTFNTTNLSSYDAIAQEIAGGGKTPTLSHKKQARISKNHQRKGQNFARLDGSVKWVLDPNDQSGNDVFSSAVKDSAEEKKGRRNAIDDPFVLP